MATGFVPWRALQMLNGWFETLLEISGEGHPSPNPAASTPALCGPGPRRRRTICFDFRARWPTKLDILGHMLYYNVTYQGYNMTRPCSICSHPNRASIDRRLAANETVRALAKELGVPKSTLQRHKSVCAGLNSSDAREAQREIVRGTIALATLPSKETMAEKYDALGARIDEIIEAAKGSGSLMVAIQGLGQLRQTFDSISKLAGHTTAPAPQVNIGINIDASSIAEKLAAALGQATPKQIEAYIERSD